MATVQMFTPSPRLINWLHESHSASDCRSSHYAHDANRYCNDAAWFGYAVFSIYEWIFYLPFQPVGTVSSSVHFYMKYWRYFVASMFIHKMCYQTLKLCSYNISKMVAFGI
jgi:hypothetical protein